MRRMKFTLRMIMIEFQLSNSPGSGGFQGGGGRHKPYGTTFQDTTIASIAVFMAIVQSSGIRRAKLFDC
jgi:hypothetical protein